MDKPEVYRLTQTDFVPNSRLPVIVYRNVLPRPLDETSTTQFLEKNEWIKGGTWGAIQRHHFHPNTHECYGVFSGSSVLLLGVGPTEDESLGHQIQMEAGDVIVLPAGVSHCSKDFNNDYRYVGVYPKGSPRWKNEYGKVKDTCQMLREQAESISIPDHDPVLGQNGPLCELWS
ncbi:hypothetical protein BGZ63DRAFT_491549 [Mariannaea sp. PMI_226]|nr:hypothetical protein BGZ63DRAFT_491549 [Mariannaea sp. PMI_226]